MYVRPKYCTKTVPQNLTLTTVVGKIRYVRSWLKGGDQTSKRIHILKVGHSSNRNPIASDSSHAIG